MGKLHNCDDISNDRFIFPLTSFQIGDLQSYLSDLSIFLANESNKLYILVDNRPWLRDLGSHPAHLWQFMVTKSRLSPFANTKAQKGKRTGKDVCSDSKLGNSKKFEKWFSLIDAATLSRRRGFLPVKKLRNTLFLSSELHRTLYGFIVFEVFLGDVRGINYLNELQTDTSLAIETKFMQRWEFDSIEQAASCLSSWFSGTISEQLHLKEYLECAIGDIFYDAEENFSRTLSIDDDENFCSATFGVEDFSVCGSFSVYPGTNESGTSDFHTPPPTGPYKRRRVIKFFGTGVEFDFYSEETGDEIEDSLDNRENYTNDFESTVEAKQYRDVLILVRFNDHDLPFKLRDVIMSDLRLLTLLEAGLPSWVIFLQSYPGFCHMYRPWMCPLARALYVLISVVTVVIGFYDLYKNVPVLKATASRLCGPLFDWIETWEMVSRIKYLGTMLFLHNFEKAITWFLTITRTTRSFFSVFTQPLAEPLVELLGFLLPTWNVLVEVVESLYSVIWAVTGSICSIFTDLMQVILWPMWAIISLIWSIATSILYPIFWILWEILYVPIRAVLGMASLIAFFCASISEFIGDIWQSLSTAFQLASASEATISTYEVSMWRSLWNDLFSQVFRALRSILNGFVAFFTACNRHRLSIYNHIQDFFRRMFGQTQRSHPSEFRHTRPTQRARNLGETSREIHIS
ncbi:uncharacterized protein LOC126655973 [Mercurialis annua]|uniref:uncharacterized protein LOC126655973 n=1 Tax=Mercurialis annua TaxID=3986 RepID=UPI00215F11ED|nr:uncharacterized protein LOC126655973 [Mercurialis annua]XP_050206354.1 uncharacterized protein LOC126655973 [Mercurialis annua]